MVWSFSALKIGGSCCPNKGSQVSYDLLLEQAVSCDNCKRTQRSAQVGLITCTVTSECVCLFYPKKELNWALEKEWFGFFTLLRKLKIQREESLIHKLWESAALMSIVAELPSHKTWPSKVRFYWNAFWQPRSILQYRLLQAQEAVIVKHKRSWAPAADSLPLFQFTAELL